MATKNLGRSALEGGRYRRYQHRVDEIEGGFRAANRNYARRAEIDPDAFDDEDIPIRQRETKQGNQTDKLSGVYRMLDGCVGRPWDKVRAEIFERFDGRTLAGRHVLYDHILRDVAAHKDVEHHYPGGKYSDYYVDDHGIFRKRERNRRRYHTDRLSTDAFVKIRAWLGGRGIIRQGSKLYWAIPNTEMDIAPNWYNVPCFVQRVVGFRTWTLRWRQDRELKGADLATFNALPAFVSRALIVRDSEAEDEAA